ncbi:MAG: acyltransferase [Planctomycetaceae bacterium]|nr:acyltransferase [Planctomycetaceae bacterium]
MTTTKPSRRLDDIDKLKGLAIFLVVVGHIVAREAPADNQWYLVLKDTIYRFHMPLFMFLSGLILAYSRRPIGNLQEYFRYVVGKFNRLMPAYLLFSLVVFSGKMLAGQFLHVDNAPESWLSYFDVVLNPLGSYCAFLWYIQVLFLFYAIMPLGYYLTGQRLQYLLPFCLILHFVPLPAFLGLSSVGEYAFVFCLGCLAGDHYTSYTSWIKRFGVVLVIPFVAALLVATAWGVPKLLLGVLSIPACHVVMGLWTKDRWHVWSTLGNYTFPIYLMNTIFIGIAKAVLFKVATWDGPNFYWFAPILLASGVIGPILIHEAYRIARETKWPLWTSRQWPARRVKSPA